MKHQERLTKLYYSGCHGKFKLSKEKADDLIDQALSEGRMMYYYRCHFCGKHHLTSGEPSKKIQSFLNDHRRKAERIFDKLNQPTGLEFKFRRLARAK